LFREMPIHVVPYALDVAGTWYPRERTTARAALGLPATDRIILMGAHGGVQDPRKGGDLLREVVAAVAAQHAGSVRLMVYGQDKPLGGESWPVPVHWLGVVADDRRLAECYSCADVMVVPSRQDNLPNTALEAHACGVPVAAFDIGGLPDIVRHRESGWLAKPFDTAGLAEGVCWILADEDRRLNLSRRARQEAVEHWAPAVIASQYREVYARAVEDGVRRPGSAAAVR
jgi:glycosyltransferase involved in cell wall biosynthesis